MAKVGRPKGSKAYGWQPKELSGKEFQEFCDWLNAWGDINKHREAQRSEEYRRGYNQAIKDAFDKLKVDYGKN